MVGDRKKLAENLGIPTENASRILIEKEKAVKQSEVKYHLKAMCQLIDEIRQTDSEFAESIARDTVKFILARHGTSESLEDIALYVENLSDNFLDKIFSDRMRDDF